MHWKVTGAMEKYYAEEGERVCRRWECDFRVAKGGLPEKVAFVQRLEGGKFKTEKSALFVTERNWEHLTHQ